MLSGAADPWPEIADSLDAPPAVRSVFNDVRAVTGSLVVNQLFRRLASDEALLQRIWRQWRPIYASGQSGLLAAQLVSATDFSLDGLQPDENLRQVAPQSLPQLCSLARVYLMNNARNLLACQALLTEAPRVTLSEAAPAETARWTAAEANVPTLPNLADLPPDTRDRIARLNRFGDDPAPRSLASLWRHLGLYPDVLVAIENRLKALEARVDLPALREATRMRALSLSARLVPMRLEDDDRAKARALIGDLADITIPKMIPISLILYRDFSTNAKEAQR